MKLGHRVTKLDAPTREFCALLITSMSKRKKVPPQLYDHNASSTVHRNISITEDHRRLRVDSNLVNLPSNPPSIPVYAPSQGSHEGIPYFFDDDHIPIDTANADAIAGVNVKVKKRAKRYENSVRTFSRKPFFMDN
jgi:hypothetical protein